ncbi:MAG: signal peptidase I [Cognaticolwellia sp.]|jgi:signal peptidase I
MQSPWFKRALLALVPLAIAAWGIRPLHVESDEMAPSITPGDWVLWLPLAPSQGDVVLLEDPSDPGRRVLRRVIAVPDQILTLTKPGVAIDGQPWRWREMGRDPEWVTYSEQDSWLVQTADRRFDEASVTLDAEAGWLLLADHRDGPVDSRQWGRIPIDDIHGRVWLRIGAADAWRGSLSWRAQDGPWIPPSKVPAQD